MCDLTPGGWKPRLHRRNLPSQVRAFGISSVRDGGPCLYSREFHSLGRECKLHIASVCIDLKKKTSENFGLEVIG
jgi:hypothetical protein